MGKRERNGCLALPNVGFLLWMGVGCPPIAPQKFFCMRQYYDLEAKCAEIFVKLGPCWHLSTSENFEIIFTSDSDFRIGMSIVGVCARLFPDVKILTFELMSNHFHFTLVGDKRRVELFFKLVMEKLSKYLKSLNRTTDLSLITYLLNPVDSLDGLRNVIVYDNRNGYIVSPDHTPVTYPWGANRYYFNSDAKTLALQNARKMRFSEIRQVSRSHKSDNMPSLLSFEGYALPLDFCDLESGEKLFRNASHYFYALSKNMESNKQIAKEIGESVFYTDNELFSIVSKISRDRYDVVLLPELTPEAKMELARTMRYEYNASAKQIIRILKLPGKVLESIGIK